MDRNFFIISDKVPGCFCSKCGKRVMQDSYNYKLHGEKCGFAKNDNFHPVRMDSYGYRLHKDENSLVFSICKPELIPIRGFRDKFSGGGWSVVFQAVFASDTKEIEVTCRKTDIPLDTWLALIRAEKVVKIHRESDRSIIHGVFPAVIDIHSLQMFVHIYRTKGYTYRKILPKKTADKILGLLQEQSLSKRVIAETGICRRFGNDFVNDRYRIEDYRMPDVRRKYRYPVEISLYYLKDEEHTCILKVLEETPLGVRGFLFSRDYVYTQEPAELYEIFQTDVWYREEDRKKLMKFADRYPEFQIRPFMEENRNGNILILLLSGNYHVLVEQAVKAGLLNVVANMGRLPVFEKDPLVYKNLKEAFGLPVSFLRKLDEDMMEPQVLEVLRRLRKHNPTFVDFDYFTEEMIRFYLDSNLYSEEGECRITGISELGSREILKILRYLREKQNLNYSFYRDYLDMCGQMHMYTDGLTPDDVYDAHNLIMELYRDKKDEMMQKQFIRKLQMKEYQRLATDQEEEDEHFFEKDEYVIILPKDSRDLVLESQQMHNCVRTYINAVSNGSTRIVFLRKKEEPEKSFGTIEVSRRNELMQAKAFANRHLDRKAQEFVRKWMKYKKLSIRTCDLAETG